MLIHNKDDFEFVTEFPCFLGHPVDETNTQRTYNLKSFQVLEISRPFVLRKGIQTMWKNFLATNIRERFVFFVRGNFKSLIFDFLQWINVFKDFQGGGEQFLIIIYPLDWFQLTQTFRSVLFVLLVGRKRYKTVIFEFEGYNKYFILHSAF